MLVLKVLTEPEEVCQPQAGSDFAVLIFTSVTRALTLEGNQIALIIQQKEGS